MQPPMTPLTERVRIEAEQQTFAKEAELARIASPRISIHALLNGIRDMLRTLQLRQFQQYPLHLNEKFDESDQTSYS